MPCTQCIDSFQAAADATKHESPNTVKFDSIQDGQLTSIKPRGCNGPCPAHSPSASSDTMALLMAAMIPLISNLVPKSSNVPKSPTTPVHARETLPISPIPGMTSELHSCLTDFVRIKGIDLVANEAALAVLDLTPDIIPVVLITHLCEVIGAVEGQIWKFQSFC